jgi:hypothetical protein
LEHRRQPLSGPVYESRGRVQHPGLPGTWGSTAPQAFLYSDRIAIASAVKDDGFITLRRGINAPLIDAKSPITAPGGTTNFASDLGRATRYAGTNGYAYEVHVGVGDLERIGPSNISAHGSFNQEPGIDIVFGPKAADFINSLSRTIYRASDIRPPLPPNAPNFNPIEP